MKAHANFKGFLLFLLVVSFVVSCSNSNPTKVQEKQLEFSAQQVPGCFSDSSLAKVLSNDSCFDYTFRDTLKIDFCVSGNCCPDSQRFVSDVKVKSDTIFVSVTDTARNLCYCKCKYKIHLEINGLSENQYLFYCDYPGRYDFQDSLRYREIVKKY